MRTAKATFGRKERMATLLCIVYLLVQSGCECDSPEMERVLIRDRFYEIRSVAQSVPYDLSNVELVACSEQEKHGIAACLGRIAATDLDIRKITIAWAERPMAARVELGRDCYLYLSRRNNGTWEVEEAIQYDLQFGEGQTTIFPR